MGRLVGRSVGRSVGWPAGRQAGQQAGRQAGRERWMEVCHRLPMLCAARALSHLVYVTGITTRACHYIR